MDNVVDMAKLRKKREELLAAANRTKRGDSKLTRTELSEALLKSADLVDQQHELLQALTRDILMLAKTYREMQGQMVMISGQAYLALEMIKEKGLATSEELQARWDQVVQAKMREVEEAPSTIVHQEQKIIIP